MEISQDDNYTYLSMCKYIADSLEIVCDMIGITVKDLKPHATPIDRAIDPDSPKLDALGGKSLLTCNGFNGWLAITMRADISLAHSRQAQHSANPTESAMVSVIHTFGYLK